MVTTSISKIAIHVYSAVYPSGFDVVITFLDVDIFPPSFLSALGEKLLH